MKKILVFLFIISNQTFSQELLPKKYALVASIGQQVDVFNFNLGQLSVIDAQPFRPRVEIGLERTWKNKKYTRFFQDFKATFVNDPYNERVFGIGSDIGLETKILKRILLTPRFGLHYNRALPTDIHYAYTDNKWQAVSNTYLKNNRLFIKLGLDLGYRINDKYDVFAASQVSLNYPHVKDVAPFYPNKALSLGIRRSF
jgi:hypothetical protein